MSTQLLCERSGCLRTFKRQPKEISPHNYCSHSCAATMTNTYRVRKKESKAKYKHGNKYYPHLKGSALGGKNRWIGYESKYTPEYIISEIRSFVSIHNRVPVKRELNILYRVARKHFGSWNNAIEDAGFDPNPLLFAKHHLAEDGHICDSLAEKVIDDYLYKQGITHERSVPYPEGKYTADFKVKNKFIEYFGLAGEHRRYDELRAIKMDLVKKYSIELIEVYPQDLYPIPSLDKLKLKDGQKLIII